MVHLEAFENSIGYSVSAININCFPDSYYDNYYGYFMKNMLYVCQNEYIYIGKAIFLKIILSLKFRI